MLDFTLTGAGLALAQAGGGLEKRFENGGPEFRLIVTQDENEKSHGVCRL